jgi:hypothetical protein
MQKHFDRQQKTLHRAPFHARKSTEALTCIARIKLNERLGLRMRKDRVGLKTPDIPRTKLEKAVGRIYSGRRFALKGCDEKAVRERPIQEAD